MPSVPHSGRVFELGEINAVCEIEVDGNPLSENDRSCGTLQTELNPLQKNVLHNRTQLKSETSPTSSGDESTPLVSNQRQKQWRRPRYNSEPCIKSGICFHFGRQLSYPGAKVQDLKIDEGSISSLSSEEEVFDARSQY